MQLIETTAFSRQARALLSDEEYRLLQLALIAQPDAGVVIPGSGGLRKLRWGLSGRGKRGGVRLVYFWRSVSGQVFLLFLYAKNDREDLTKAELKALRTLMGADNARNE